MLTSAYANFSYPVDKKEELATLAVWKIGSIDAAQITNTMKCKIF
jgi:hypothetical protein